MLNGNADIADITKAVAIPFTCGGGKLEVHALLQRCAIRELRGNQYPHVAVRVKFGVAHVHINVVKLRSVGNANAEGRLEIKIPNVIRDVNVFFEYSFRIATVEQD